MTVATSPLGGRPRVVEPNSVPPWGLDRRFEAVVFDWDGTAVPERGADATEVRGAVEELCAHGMDVAVVTGTNIRNVDAQLGARPDGPGRLYLCLNRGSEVYAVDERGPHLIFRRLATEAEEAALDAAAGDTVARFAARGVSAEIVSERLNRRKIDVIPVTASGPIRRRPGSASCSRRSRAGYEPSSWTDFVRVSAWRRRRRATPGWRSQRSRRTPSTSRSVSPIRPTPPAGSLTSSGGGESARRRCSLRATNSARSAGYRAATPFCCRQ